MIWTLIVAIILFFIIRFITEYNKDNYDLSGQKLDEKFSVVVKILNDFAFDSKGKITYKDKRLFNLYRDKDNQIIYFNYSRGNLTIIWKYKYFQKEVSHKKIFYDVRNLSIFEQREIGEAMIKEMVNIVQRHKTDVITK